MSWLNVQQKEDCHILLQYQFMYDIYSSIYVQGHVHWARYVTIKLPPKPGPQSRALCGAVCALSIAIVL